MHCNILVFLFIIIMRPKTTIIFSHHDSGSYFLPGEIHQDLLSVSIWHLTLL
jgi:hypothetical protein